MDEQNLPETKDIKITLPEQEAPLAISLPSEQKNGRLKFLKWKYILVIIFILIIGVLGIFYVYKKIKLQNQAGMVKNVPFSSLPEGFPAAFNITPKALVLKNYNVYYATSTEAVREFGSISNFSVLHFAFLTYLQKQGWQINQDDLLPSNIENKLAATKGLQNITIDILAKQDGKQNSLVTITIMTKK